VPELEIHDRSINYRKNKQDGESLRGSDFDEPPRLLQPNMLPLAFKGV